ncbi:hypothetical protein GCM10012285_67120 [Streptomyces kronopolitis]|uniref:Uncharacterized protein n=1 Tax=Streptomyces kronopolitis TaxID=1612435 RepID=A0ABQ2K3L8_9ACTN|nr:hypothetical protein [Streptomyces kronopolitis]GGN64790.1 hypothetical protein GCM10012285_67120 [Streptomyces kronopolitis]
MDVRPDHLSAWEGPLKTRLYAMTHVMEISRADGRRFTASEYSLGRWTAPLLLVDGGADARACLAYKDDQVRRCLGDRPPQPRPFVKWASFNHQALGEHSGVYLAIFLDHPLRDAYAEGVATVEACTARRRSPRSTQRTAIPDVSRWTSTRKRSRARRLAT